MQINWLNWRAVILNAIVPVFGVILLFIAHNIAMSDAQLFITGVHTQTVEARVIRVMAVERDEFELGGMSVYELAITFEATPGGLFTRGSDDMIIATQRISSFGTYSLREVAEGDRVVIMLSDDEWLFFEHVRIGAIFILVALFAVLLVVLGRIKGLNSLISLCLTCIAIFSVFVPALLSGRNIYLWAVLVCIYTVVVTLFTVSGINKKSAAAVIGCMGGVIAAGLLAVLMINAINLTGVLDPESISLLHLREEAPIDLRAIIFASIIIGAVGALMDVAMSISSALWELKSQADDASFKGLVKSGLNIGRDIMGTMANTLVLAYIGGSLTITLLMVTFTSSPAHLLNIEAVIVDILQAVIGSLGILLTMPLTVIICALWFSRDDGFSERPARALRIVNTKEDLGNRLRGIFSKRF